MGNVVTVILEMTPSSMHTTSAATLLYVDWPIVGASFCAVHQCTDHTLLYPPLNFRAPIRFFVGLGDCIFSKVEFELLGDLTRTRNKLLLLSSGAYILSSVLLGLVVFFARRGVLSLRAHASRVL